MSQITIKITPEELELLTMLASDQLFRREFIDPKMPGHQSNRAQNEQAKALVARLRAILHPNAKRTSANGI